MAACMIKMCLKKRSPLRILNEIIQIELIGNQKQNTYTKICVKCNWFHTTPIFFRKKNKEQKKDLINNLNKSNKQLVINIWKNMTVQELSEQSGRSVSDVLQAISYADNSVYTKHTIIDNRQVIYEAVRRLGAKYELISNPHHNVEIATSNHDIMKRPPPDPSITVKRHPVVTIMGHVDHGKTTLLDSLRHTSVVESESGGITQHIGAFNVTLDSGEKITFLDTPGHAAFSAMRSRGANATDIVILVVAADDGVMEQTIQSIKMAKDANVPIIVAINKIDKPEANIERTQKMLAEHGVYIESLGGEVPSVNISALKGLNFTELIETIVAQAEIMNLRGDPKGLVEGVVLEVTTEISRGKLATALIQRGTLRKGSIIISGLAWGKVRAMFDHAGNPVSEAKLSEAVQIIGWRELPLVGDDILEIENEQKVNSVLRYREMQQSKIKNADAFKFIQKKQEEHNQLYKKALHDRRAMGKLYGKTIDKSMDEEMRQKEIEAEKKPRVNTVIKADVLGSMEAILDIFDTYGDENRCRLDVVHYGIGPVTEKDVELAKAFNAIIYTFHTSVPKPVEIAAKKLGVPIHPFKVIYKLVDDIKVQIVKQLPPDQVEDKIGEANVQQYFQINEKNKKVSVAGCRCTYGTLKKNNLFRIIRNGDVIYDGKLVSMKHFKEEVNSVKKESECGLRFEDPSIVVQPGDTVVCYEIREVPPKINWDVGF